jgi:hypothetical protein
MTHGDHIQDLIMTGGLVPSHVEDHGQVLRPRDLDSMASGERARRRARGGCIQELIMIGGPTPSLAKDHGQILHPRGQDPLAHGGQTRRTTFDSHAREPATTRQPIPFIHEPSADESKRKKTPAGREINVNVTQARATLAYLKWSEAALTFGRSDHANHI